MKSRGASSSLDLCYSTASPCMRSPPLGGDLYRGVNRRLGKQGLYYTILLKDLMGNIQFKSSWLKLVIYILILHHKELTGLSYGQDHEVKPRNAKLKLLFNLPNNYGWCFVQNFQELIQRSKHYGTFLWTVSFGTVWMWISYFHSLRTAYWWHI